MDGETIIIDADEGFVVEPHEDEFRITPPGYRRLGLTFYQATQAMDEVRKLPESLS